MHALALGARAPRSCSAWREWTATAPDEVTHGVPHAAGPAAAGDPRAGPRPRVRGHRRRRTSATRPTPRVLAAAARARARRSTRSATVPPAALVRLHMDPEEPDARHRATARCSTRCRAEAIDALVAVAGAGSGSPLLMVELRQLGGALGRAGAGPRRAGDARRRVRLVRRGHGARRRDGGGDRRRARRRWSRTRWSRGTPARRYLNFAERPIDTRRRSTTRGAYRRLQARQDAGRPGRHVPGQPPDRADRLTQG